MRRQDRCVVVAGTGFFSCIAEGVDSLPRVRKPRLIVATEPWRSRLLHDVMIETCEPLAEIFKGPLAYKESDSIAEVATKLRWCTYDRH